MNVNLKAKHAVVGDACRANRGDAAAIDEAVARVRTEALRLAERWPAGQGVKLHFVLTIERELEGTKNV